MHPNVFALIRRSRDFRLETLVPDNRSRDERSRETRRIDHRYNETPKPIVGLCNPAVHGAAESKNAAAMWSTARPASDQVLPYATDRLDISGAAASGFLYLSGRAVDSRRDTPPCDRRAGRAPLPYHGV